eukprot:GHVU01047297.1.p2 GENE.GHVU01047297.1~~GHVU01047297.1.p2  ORF type:complete len:289 (+),score=38.98 GHVU01047297.1:1028-1894(+)
MPTPRGADDVSCVLAYRQTNEHWELHAAQVLKSSTRGRQLQVSWLRETPEKKWEVYETDTVKPSNVAAHFRMVDATLPEDALKAIGSRREHQEAHFTLLEPKYSGGSTQQPAKAMDVLQGKYDLAKMKEFATVISKGVIGPQVHEEAKGGEMKMGWRLTEKNSTTGERTYKARWFAKGCMNRQRCETFAGTPNLHLILLCLTFGVLINNWAAYTTDVTAAFLNAEVGDYRAIVVLDQAMPALPEVCPFIEFTSRQWTHIRAAAAGMKPGQRRRLKKALYGDRRSPYLG